MRAWLGKRIGAWIRPLRHCWKFMKLMWLSVILGFVTSVGASWFLTKHKLWDVSDTPFGWLLDHLAITLLGIGGALAFTILVRFAFIQEEKKRKATVMVSAHHSPSLDTQDRTRLCQLLAQWYQEFLSDSLQQAVKQLDLDLAEKPDALFTPLAQAVRELHLPERPLQAGTSIMQIYEKAHHSLCILGEPGAGKSMQLYLLAQHLLQRAETDQKVPIPLVFWLSEWTSKHSSLELWMIEQLMKKYGISRTLAQQLVIGRQITPLLDGLNEAPEEARSQCIAAINMYLEYPHSLVVCSTSTEYTAASRTAPLHLQLAVVVKPLTDASVTTILANEGRSLAGLRAAYKRNPALRELATTPLLLNLLVLTYRGVTARDLPTKAPELQREIFEQYVTLMINHKGRALHYTPQQIRHWLAWLAHQMRLHNQTVFVIEDLQSDWLPRKSWWPSSWCPRWLRTGGMWLGKTRFVKQIMSPPVVPLAEQLTWSWKKARPGLIATISMCGILVVLSQKPFAQKPMTTFWDAIPIVYFGLFLLYILVLQPGLIPQRIPAQSQLQPGEGLHRSWRNGLLIGLPAGIIIGAGFGFMGHLFGLSWMLLGILAGLYIGLMGVGGGFFAVLNHYVWRWQLWRAGVFPLRALKFLDGAHALHLLKRTGGSYRFMHGLLQEFFEESEPF
ncbi:MAG TPA: hypothetical protein VFV38_31550 [Ktedonobacteraceae bacterium]|nr:hypothetical protein [Ktedonobacteraceae bacterium]